jgi:hypothetical protein
LIDKRKIKSHFTFTYLNFGSLVYLIGCLSGMFINENSYGIYLMALFAGCGAISYYAHLNKSFLFILYAFVFSYIGITFLLTDIGMNDPFIWFFYLLASCGGFIFFIIRFKSYFKRSS